MNRIRKDTQLQIQAIASKGLGSISYRAALNVSAELKAIEERVEKVIRVNEHRIQTAMGSQELAQERDDFSNELYSRPGMAKAMNTQTTRVTDASLSGTKGGGDSVSDPIEVWFVPDGQDGNKDVTIAQLLALKILKGHRYDQVEVLLQAMKEAEELGTRPTPKCKTRTGCTECIFRRSVQSSQESKIIMRIEAKIRIHPIIGKITASYPWKPCGERLVSTREQVKKLQTKTEASMIRDGTHQQYLDEV